MPYTVPVSFDRFIDNISLTGDHKEVAKARRERLVSLLEKHFTILDAFETGSIPKGTALKNQADVDVMVVLHYSKHIKGKSPKDILQDVRDALGEYRTNVRKNGQAVTLYYDSWPDVDIVPVAANYNADNTVNYYEVPDTNTGRWYHSRPRKHANAINQKATECGTRFKPLIRMLKTWNKEHSDLLESYHIEVITLTACSGSMSDYPWAVFKWFDDAVNLVSGPLAYDGSYVDDYLIYDGRQEVLKRLRTARDKARDAWHQTYGTNNNDRRAIEIWGQVFGSKFPTYG
jgi:hypothetical protein